MNSKESNRIKIKVLKIKAVKKIDENSYSQEQYYWFNEESGVVYDLDLNFPVGRIDKDTNNNFIKLDNEIYIIVDVINIPEFKLYD
jgi:hypothetical protein